MTVPRINKLRQSNVANFTSNERNTKLSNFVGHIDFVVTNQGSQNVLKRVVDSCVHLDPYSFDYVVLKKK